MLTIHLLGFYYDNLKKNHEREDIVWHRNTFY